MPKAIKVQGASSHGTNCPQPKGNTESTVVGIQKVILQPGLTPIAGSATWWGSEAVMIATVPSLLHFTSHTKKADTGGGGIRG